MYTASNMGVTGFLFRFLSLFLGIAVPWNGVCRGQLYPPWFAYYPPNYSAWLPAGSALGWGAGAGQGIAGAYYDDLNVPPISTLSATAAAANQGRALSGAPPPANNLQSVTQSAAFTKINDITAKSTASVSSSDTQLTAVNENFQSSSSAASVPGACSGSRSARTEKERQIYMFSCAQLPEGLRDYVGCPLELPFDLSFNRVIGYAPIKDVFVNADLQQSGQLVEGDMRTPSTKDLLGIRHICGNKGLWAGGVPYTIDNKTFSQEQMDYITARMCNITARTCVRFFPRTNERDYLAIVSHTGCWSFVGRQGGKQLLSLQILNKNGQSCLNGTIVEHELLHALGFVHEHTRLDRDTYIKIDLDNVEPLYREQFGKYARQFVSIIPYDVHSVMHYSSATFALNLTLPVITIVQPINATTVNVTTLLIAPALALSELDIQRINELYGCTPRPHVSGGTTTVAPVNTTVSCVDPLLTGNDDLPDPTAADTCELFGAATGAGVG